MSSVNIDCSAFECSKNADCDQFGLHVLCLNPQKNDTSSMNGTCGCDPTNIWPLDHDTQQCLAERSLLIDIFVAGMVVVLLFSIFGLLIKMVIVCFPRRRDYEVIRDSEGVQVAKSSPATLPNDGEEEEENREREN